MNKEKTSIVFIGDIGFDRYMDKRWEDDDLLSKPVLDFFHSADHTVANVEGALIDAVDDGSRGIFFHSMNPAATRVLEKMRADIWSIGNNHTMDAGAEGVQSTKKIAADMGCRTMGAGMNEVEASEPIYLDEAGGIGMFNVAYQAERIDICPLPDVFTNIPAGEYELLAPLSAKAFVVEDMRKMVYLEPKRFTDAPQEVWDGYFFSEEPDGFFAGAHMDFNIIVPYSKKADEGGWKKSKLEKVKEYILRQL